MQVKARLCDTPRPTVDVTQRGITVGYLISLVKSGALDGNWTIQETVDRFVRPITRKYKCCLFDVVPPDVIGTPQFFISHTWCDTGCHEALLICLHSSMRGLPS